MQCLRMLGASRQSLQRRSKHASGDPFQHSLEEGTQKNLFQGSQTTMEDQKMLRVPRRIARKLMKHSLGRLYRILVPDQISADSTHEVLNLEVFEGG